MQVLSPESLAIYPKRIGTNRANAYPHSGVYGSLVSGLPVFNSSTCANSAPSVSGPPNEIVSEELLQQLTHPFERRRIAAGERTRNGQQSGGARRAPSRARSRSMAKRASSRTSCIKLPRQMMSEDDRHQYHASDVDLVGDPDDGDWSIRCLDVHKRLGGVPVLDGLNVAFPEDKITVVLGPSGTGKSVLIKHIIGLMFPDSGDVVVQRQSRSKS